MFTSTVDIINANRGQTGLHPVVYHRHFKVMRAKELAKADTAIKDMQPDNMVDFEEQASATVRGSATA